MLGVAQYIFRLLPANPILLRVVSVAGKRRRDLLIRCTYLAVLIGVVIVALLGSSQELGTGGLAELADVSTSLFKTMSLLQLALVALLAPVFAAGAITQEKDAQTYEILLSTPLTNGQIVLGSLCSRLFFVLALLVSGIPIFAITQVFGGVGIGSIALSFLIGASTACVTGALAMAIATFKVGTRRTIFSFYLFIAIYLVGVYLLDQLDSLHPLTDKGERIQTSWVTGLHPFLALRSIFNDPQYLPPSLADLPENLRGWPIGWYLSRPHSFFITFMLSLSLVLVLPSIAMLRRVAQASTTWRGWLLQKVRLSRGDSRRTPRSVWQNPIAWREARTKASAFRASMLHYLFLSAGVIGALALVVMYGTTQTPARLIDRNAIDLRHRTVSIISGDQATTYTYDPATVAVTRRGQAIDLPSLVGQKWSAQITARGNRLTTLEVGEIPRQLAPRDAKRWLLGLVLIEMTAILLIVTNAAASTVTREKEDGSLDILLATPITSHYYVWGKLRGLVSLVLPLIAVPVVSVGLFVGYELLEHIAGSATAAWIVLPESLLILPLMLIIISAVAALVGMQMSLRCRRTVTAVMASVGIVAGFSLALGGCGTALLDSTTSPATMAFVAFSPLSAICVLLDGEDFASRLFTANSHQVTDARVVLVIFSVLSLAAYAALATGLYRWMVKSFDMTIRRQSR